MLSDQLGMKLHSIRNFLNANVFAFRAAVLSNEKILTKCEFTLKYLPPKLGSKVVMHP
jgi:hypothetical protein